MNDAELEHRLATLAAPALPPTWKAGILASTRPPSPFAWIERASWSALAAAWLLIFTLHLTTPFVARPSGPAISGAEMAAHWQQVRLYTAWQPPLDEQTSLHIHLEQEFILPLHPRS